MICTECGGKTTVLSTRTNGKATARERKCLDCGNRYYTCEMIASKSVFRRVEKQSEFMAYVKKEQRKRKGTTAEKLSADKAK